MDLTKIIGDFRSFFADMFGENFLNIVKSIKFVDVIDILLLSVFLFSVYKFIRARRAGTLAIGLLLIIALLLLSIIFNMRAIKYILQNFYQVGLIAFIIIFQADLRAGLERVGTTSIKNFKPNTDADYKAVVNMAEILSESADKLSREKTGALIVLERETKLGDYLSQGTIINAELSDELIRNVFYDKAPLHDGAVIIRDRKLYAAGCYLPLSQADVNKELGTRHRAAIGLSESSDALVIVVSEENGTISAAFGGTLMRNFNKTSLNGIILKYMIPEESTVKKLRHGIKSKLRRNKDTGKEDK